MEVALRIKEMREIMGAAAMVLQKNARPNMINTLRRAYNTPAVPLNLPLLKRPLNGVHQPLCINAASRKEPNR